MTKQTFTTGQVLTAAQMTSLQQTAMGGGSTTAKTASYVLVAADAGTVVQMNSASATTITVNTALFAAGDTVQIQNVGAGVCTVTAGTATVSTAGSLALSQYAGGQLYFNTTSAALFFDLVQSATGGGKVLQVVSATTTTVVSSATSTFVDTSLTATITPTLNTSKVLVLIAQNGLYKNAVDATNCIALQLLRGATVLASLGTEINYQNATQAMNSSGAPLNYLDSPATTSATTYKTQFKSQNNTGTVYVQSAAGGTTAMSTIVLMEIGA